MPNELVRKVMAALSSTGQSVPDNPPNPQGTSLKLCEEDQDRLRHLIADHKNSTQSPLKKPCKTTSTYKHHRLPKGSWSLSDLAASKSGNKS